MISDYAVPCDEDMCLCTKPFTISPFQSIKSIDFNVIFSIDFFIFDEGWWRNIFALHYLPWNDYTLCLLLQINEKEKAAGKKGVLRECDLSAFQGNFNVSILE